MSETRLACSVCGIEFEPKTPIVTRGHPSNYGRYHAGCWQLLEREFTKVAAHARQNYSTMLVFEK